MEKYFCRKINSQQKWAHCQQVRSQIVKTKQDDDIKFLFTYFHRDKD